MKQGVLRQTAFHATALIVAVSTADQVRADFVHTDNVIAPYGICTGAGCADGEFFDDYPLMLQSFNNRIKVEDTSTALGRATMDWELIFNEEGYLGLDKFSIRDLTNGKTPFTIEGGANENALYVDELGRLGLGTDLIGASVHIAAPGASPSIRFEATSSTNPYTWDIFAGSWIFAIFDTVENVVPLGIETGAPMNAFWMKDSGHLGLGTDLPEGKLHTKGDGVQLAYFESGDGDAVQVRFRTDSENRRFLAVDNADNVKTQMQFRDDAILFLGQTVAQEWLRVDATGITTAGPTCNPNPCDATFDKAAFTVPPIQERAAMMWQQKHLPAIGPTKPGRAINLTEKTGGIIHELEIAHIYIEQLHSAIASQSSEILTLQAKIAQLDEIQARIEALEMQ